MRVLNPAPVKPNEQEIVCPHCGATLAFYRREVHFNIDNDYLVNIDFAWIDCLDCGSTIEIFRTKGKEKFFPCTPQLRRNLLEEIKREKKKRGIII